MERRTLAWFIPLMIVLVLLVVCVVLLGTTNLLRAVQNVLDPPVTTSIGGLDRLPDGERVQVEGYFHDRNMWIVIRGEYDCDNYFLSANRAEPYGATVDLCVRLGHGLYEPTTALEGQRVRISGVLSFDESDQRPNVSLNRTEDIQAAP
jgi:hypothetical protein